MIEELNLKLSGDDREKLEIKKKINELKLSIPCTEKQKIKLKKGIKEIEIELTDDTSEKMKLSEEVEALEELLQWKHKLVPWIMVLVFDLLNLVRND